MGELLPLYISSSRGSVKIRIRDEQADEWLGKSLRLNRNLARLTRHRSPCTFLVDENGRLKLVHVSRRRKISLSMMSKKFMVDPDG
jgi:hypothetical protein